MFFFYCIACVVSVSAKVTLLESAAFGQCIFSSWSGPLALKSSGDFRRGEEVRPFFTYVFYMVPGIRAANWGAGGFFGHEMVSGGFGLTEVPFFFFFSDFSTVPFNK